MFHLYLGQDLRDPLRSGGQGTLGQTGGGTVGDGSTQALGRGCGSQEEFERLVLEAVWTSFLNVKWNINPYSLANIASFQNFLIKQPENTSNHLLSKAVN